MKVLIPALVAGFMWTAFYVGHLAGRRAAGDNHRQLVRLVSDVLHSDSQVPFLSRPQRDQAERLVAEFYEKTTHTTDQGEPE